MSRFTLIAGASALAACAALAGCNTIGTTSATAPAPNYATQRYTPQDFKLPEGKGCSGAIQRWQAVQRNDYASGNVNADVYKQIQGEIATAADACSAGRDGEAIQLVAASKRRHGYPS